SVKDSSLVEMTLNNIHSILNNILDKLDPSKYKVDLTKSDEANLKLNTSKINVDINGKSTVNVKVSAQNTTKATTATTKKTTASTKKTNQTKASVSKTATKKVSSSKSSISEALRKYLASTKNCQVKNKEIQDLAKTLTSKLKSDYEKGKKLFNWVRDNIHYKKYRNTLRGAVKTLKAKKGNCVDQSHLLIALSRASGIPARYVKGGDCKFTSGYVSGHIWTQLYINKKWVVADTTSPRNTLGKIRNWNTKNYKLYGQFSSISF
ncbi:MAG: transglutaminase domain-containing protein, partial [Methanobrevibacter sp.]|nr:transglutaminase domain-containing protein [Methanobrevibacter sp.]